MVTHLGHYVSAEQQTLVRVPSQKMLCRKLCHSLVSIHLHLYCHMVNYPLHLVPKYYNSSSNRSPYRIQCNSSSNRSPYRIQCNSSSNRSPYNNRYILLHILTLIVGFFPGEVEENTHSSSCPLNFKYVLSS